MCLFRRDGWPATHLLQKPTTGENFLLLALFHVGWNVDFASKNFKANLSTKRDDVHNDNGINEMSGVVHTLPNVLSCIFPAYSTRQEISLLATFRVVATFYYGLVGCFHSAQCYSCEF